ncbi:major facilitator superfamily domain-containing protein [Gigaspora rosea]|uniref:Major facilitator superfamily domain-containing protein n=1 Tax=Gigaspora rosea TaxID=44941 RepID=A0A397TXG1_9GLOM|nr:major facilitator superfamily domain-containing protein [Gigaspora rosea]
MSYFSQTPSSINSLSSIYLLLYPILFIPSIKFFNTYGIKFGVIFGAFLNSLGALLRFLGSLKRSYIGFWILFLGQTIAALAQLFMLCVPPKLANIWFSQFGQQNFATSVGITANSAGVAIGFILSPWMIKEKTANHDIPNYLLLQFIVCAMIYLFLIFTFKSSPDKRTNRTMPLSTTNLNISDYFSDKMFMILTISFGIVTGGEYALSTLLSQMILPVFEKFDESTIGLLGFFFVIAGMVGSLVIGIYLDHTLAYKSSYRYLYIGSIITLGLSNIALKYEFAELFFYKVYAIKCMLLTLAPTAFQYATIVISKRLSTDEITTTGILNASASLFGILLISLMDTLENLNKKFTMELSNWVLFVILIGGFWLSFWISPTKDDRKDDRDDRDEEEYTNLLIGH